MSQPEPGAQRDPQTDAQPGAAADAAPDRATDAEERAAAARRPGSSVAAARIREQHLWVDAQVREAMARGDFDDLAGAGQPIRDLGASHDPDWWVKRLVEREQLTGIAPPAILLRREDAELDALLDRETAESEVRRLVADFNRRVVEARRQLQGGPPVVTRTRDVDAEVAAWAARREQRRAAQRALAAATPAPPPRPRRWSWGRRRRAES